METGVPLDAVIDNEALERRAGRAPGREAQSRGLNRLAEELAGSPRHVLQKLSDVALELCRAHSAGVSLREEEGGRRIFRWHAVSGQMAPHLWSTLPGDHSPCGTVLERKSPQLMVLPGRHFTSLRDVTPPMVEALLIPFSVGNEMVGAVWVVAHDHTRKFDREDLRILSVMGTFASSAYEKLSSLSADEVLTLARLNKAQALPPELPSRRVQRRILVVDDHADAASALEMLLKQMGHKVDVAHDGQAALHAARAARPDVVLLDLAMPGMSGHEVARQLRQFLGRAVRIIAVTGFGGEEDRQEAIEAGFDQHIVKPIDLSVLKSLTG